MSDLAITTEAEKTLPASASTPAATMPVGWLTLLFCAAAVVAASIVLLHSGRNYQETVALQFAQMHAGVPVVRYVSPDDPVPLYYAGVYIVSRWLAPTLTHLRLLSLFAYLLTLPVAYLLASKATNDRRAGLLAVVLLGISPFFVWYASRATVYAFLPLAVLVNAYFFVSILHGSRWAWMGYIPTALVGLGLHYFFIVVLVMQLLFGLMEFGKLRLTARILLPVVVLGCAAGLGTWIHYTSSFSPIWRQLPYTARPASTNVFIIFVEFLFGFQSVTTITFVISPWPLLVILALLAIQKYVKPPLAVRYFAFAAIGPVIACFALGWVLPPLFLSSYLIVCLPPFILLVAWYAATFELRILVWARSVLIVTMAVMLLLELANLGRALSGDYLGAARVPERGLIVETLLYHPALSASVVAYSGHQTPAAGPPLQVPSDSPGVLIHK